MRPTLKAFIATTLFATGAFAQVPHAVRGVFERPNTGPVEVICAARGDRFRCISAQVDSDGFETLRSGTVPVESMTIVSLRGSSRIGPSKQRLYVLYSGLELMRARAASTEFRRLKVLPPGSTVNGRAINRDRLLLTEIMPFRDDRPWASSTAAVEGRVLFDPSEARTLPDAEDLESWILGEETENCREWLQSIGCQSWSNTAAIDDEGYIIDELTLCECHDSPSGGGSPGGGPGVPGGGGIYPGGDIEWVEIDFDEEWEEEFGGIFDKEGEDDEGLGEPGDGDNCQDCTNSCEGICAPCCAGP